MVSMLTNFENLFKPYFRALTNVRHIIIITFMLFYYPLILRLISLRTDLLYRIVKTL